MRIKISESSFRYIEVYKCNYLFEKNNSGRVRCRDCKSPIEAGLGIYRQSYKRSGFLCFSCFALDVTILTKGIDKKDAGFFVDSIGRLRACSFRAPSLSTVEVIEAVFSALREMAYTSIDILLGEEGAHPFKILDTVDSVINAK